MKKTLTILFIALSAVIILDSFHVWDALTLFVLAGVVPGTNTAINAMTMLDSFALLLGFTLSRITRSLTAYYGSLLKRHNALSPKL